MKKYAFIWDLDGTLLNSYGEIVASIRLAFEAFGVEMDEKDILDFTINKSGRDLLEKVSKENNISFDHIHEAYRRFHHEKSGEVMAAEHAEQILNYMTSRGIPCFVITHRGSSTLPVLKRLRLYDYFIEIITKEAGFARKPAPDAAKYLIEKYSLDPECTYFVGDRQIDMQSAKNAGVGKILYKPSYSIAQPSGIEDYVISDFMEIPDLIIKD